MARASGSRSTSLFVRLCLVLLFASAVRQAAAQCEEGRVCPPDVYEPLCASDFVTYSNTCEFELAQCVNTTLTVLANEPCASAEARGLFDDDDSANSDDDDSEELLLLLLLLIPLALLLARFCMVRRNNCCGCMPNYCCGC